MDFLPYLRDIRKINVKDTLLVLPSTLRNGCVIPIGGYRHDLNPILAASLISQKEIKITNVPNLDEIKILSKILQLMNINIYLSTNSIKLEPSSFSSSVIPESLSVLVHGALYLVPAILGRCGQVRLGGTGGCQIGEGGIGKRPIDHLSEIFSQFGVNSTIKDGIISAHLDQGWKPAHIDIKRFSNDPCILTGPRVSNATKFAILLALNVKKGKTIIDNPSLKAGTNGLLEFCRNIGYKIEQSPTCITIEYIGTKQNRIVFELQADVAEVITFLTFLLTNQLQGSLYKVNSIKLSTEISKEFTYFQQLFGWSNRPVDSLEIFSCSKITGGTFEASSIGIATDSQPLLALLMAYADRSSIIRDKIWKGRFDYVKHLNELGYCMEVRNQDEVLIKNRINPPPKHPLFLAPKDLRSAAVTLLGAICQNATCLMTGKQHIDRGYDRLIDKLRFLGVNIITGKNLKTFLKISNTKRTT